MNIEKEVLDYLSEYLSNSVLSSEIDLLQLDPKQLSLTKDLQLDSLDLVEAIMHFENLLHITVNEEDEDEIETIQQFIDYLTLRQVTNRLDREE